MPRVRLVADAAAAAFRENAATGLMEEPPPAP